MKFDIARQPLVPAFLTLLLLALVATWGAAHPVVHVSGGEHVELLAEGTVPVEGMVAAPVEGTGPAVASAAIVPEGLCFAPAGDSLRDFQTAHPGWARTFAILLLLFGGTTLARIAIRYNLYTVNTCLPIPLYGIIVCALALDGSYLVAVVTSTLFVLSVKNFGRSFCSGYGFDGIFRASLYLGLLLLVSPVALPLLVLLPIALILFGRTFREAAVALFGLLLPAATLCYLNWGEGGTFAAPLQHLGASLLEGEWLGLFAALPLPTQVLAGLFALLAVLAFGYFCINRYSASTKSRYILVFVCCALVCALLPLAAPAATRGAIALAAVPAALLLPLFFIRISRSIALSLYLLMLAGALAGAFIG